MNRLSQNAVARLAEEEEEKQLFDSFSLLGDNPDMSDVSYTLQAQSEVVLNA